MSFLLALWAAAVDPGELERKDVQAALDATLRGDLDEAAALYRTLVTRGFDSADLLYNLGTVEAERGRDVEAAAALLAALRRDPGHADARHNLEALQPPLDARAPTLVDALRPLSGALPFSMWFGLLAVANALIALAVATRHRAALAGAGALLGLPAAVALYALHLEAHRPLAVAEADRPLRSGPAPRYPARSEVRGAEVLRIVDRAAGWSEVATRDGRSGWLEDGDLVEVPPVDLLEDHPPL